MAKRYIRINWQNKPSTATPLSAEFLNKMDKGIDDCDTAIEDLYGIKINSSSIVQTDQTNDATKVPSSAVTYAHGQAISTINSNLGNLSNSLSAYKLTQMQVNSQADLDNAINDLSRFSNGVCYRFNINVNVSNLPIGGGTWYVEGVKVDADYGWQMIVQYGSPTTIKYRSKMVAWGSWETK